MSTRPDLDRSISAWLVAEAPGRAPTRLLEEARERIRTTPQRRAWWPPRKPQDMKAYAKLAIAAAAVLVVAIGGFSELSSLGVVGGPPSGLPSAACDESYPRGL